MLIFSGYNCMVFRRSSEKLPQPAFWELYWLNQQTEEITDSSTTDYHVQELNHCRLSHECFPHPVGQTSPHQLKLLTQALPKQIHLTGISVLNASQLLRNSRTHQYKSQMCCIQKHLCFLARPVMSQSLISEMRKKMGQRKKKKKKGKLQCRLAFSFLQLQTTILQTVHNHGKNDTTVTFAGFGTVMPKSRGSSWNATEMALDITALGLLYSSYRKSLKILLFIKYHKNSSQSIIYCSQDPTVIYKMN